MGQLSLLFDPPAARCQTSRAAAASIERTAATLRESVLAFIRARADGATDEEIADALHLDANSARPRRIELRNRGLVRDSGDVRPTRRHKMAIVWVVAAAGDDRRGPVARPAPADRAGDVADQAGPDGLFPHAPDDVRYARWEDCRPWPIHPPAEPDQPVK